MEAVQPVTRPQGAPQTRRGLTHTHTVHLKAGLGNRPLPPQAPEHTCNVRLCVSGTLPASARPGWVPVVRHEKMCLQKTLA